jgi:type I restriction enzyme S subunit
MISTKDVSTKPGYKKNKLGWIPEEWDLTALGSATVLLTNGFVGSIKEHYSDSDDSILYIQGFNVNENSFNMYGVKRVSLDFHEKHKKSTLKEGDLLTIQTGDIGLTTIVPKKLEGSNCHALVISRFKKNFLPIFYSQYFNSYIGRARFKRIETGTTMKHLNVGDMKSWDIPIPPLPEQQKIAEILSTWDEAIESTQELIKQLKKRKKGLMQQLLTGRLRLRSATGKPYEGEWEEKRIGEIAEHYGLKNSKDEDLTVLSCTKYDGLVPSLEYFGRKVYGDDTSKYKLVPRGYFAYATNHIEEGSIGLQRNIEKGLVSPMYTVFKTKSNINDEFLFRLLKTDLMIYKYQSNMSGSIARRGGLRWNDFKTITVCIPDLVEQTSIAYFFDKIDEEINMQSNKLNQLQTQKRGLMQQLLTGQKRVQVN